MQKLKHAKSDSYLNLCIFFSSLAWVLWRFKGIYVVSKWYRKSCKWRSSTINLCISFLIKVRKLKFYEGKADLYVKVCCVSSCRLSVDIYKILCLPRPWDYLRWLEHGANTKVVDSIHAWAIQLRIKWDDPCGCLPTQNILWICGLFNFSFNSESNTAVIES